MKRENIKDIKLFRGVILKKKIIEAQSPLGAIWDAGGAIVNGGQKALQAVEQAPLVGNDPKTNDPKVNSRRNDLAEWGQQQNSALAALGVYGYTLQQADGLARSMQATTGNDSMGDPLTIYKYLSDACALALSSSADKQSFETLTKYMLKKTFGDTDSAIKFLTVLKDAAIAQPELDLWRMLTVSLISGKTSAPYLAEAALDPNSKIDITGLMSLFNFVSNPNSATAAEVYKASKIHQRMKTQQQLFEIKINEELQRCVAIADIKMTDYIARKNKEFDPNSGLYKKMFDWFKTIYFGALVKDLWTKGTGLNGGSGYMSQKAETNKRVVEAQAQNQMPPAPGSIPQTMAAPLPNFSSNTPPVDPNSPWTAQNTAQPSQQGAQGTQQGQQQNQQQAVNLDVTNLEYFEALLTNQQLRDQQTGNVIVNGNIVANAQTANQVLNLIQTVTKSAPIVEKTLANCEIYAKSLMTRLRAQDPKDTSLEGLTNDLGTADNIAEEGNYLLSQARAARDVLNKSLIDACKKIVTIAKQNSSSPTGGQMFQALNTAAAARFALLSNQKRMCLQYMTQGVVAVEYGPIQKQINLLNVKEQALAMQVDAWSGQDGLGAVMSAGSYEWVGQQINIWKQKMQLINEGISKINKVEEENRSDKDFFAALWKVKDKLHLQVKALRLQIQQAYGKMAFQDVGNSSIPGLSVANPLAATENKFVKVADKKAKFIKPVPKDEESPEETDENGKPLFKEGDQRIEDYYEDFYPGWGKVLNNPKKHRKTRIKFRKRKTTQ